ncbi:MAG: hypothetical protein HW374_630, partial [Bacteroidetes bacterium]|nr:hypothetical protein [Bacteroidota bacterium]
MKAKEICHLGRIRLKKRVLLVVAFSAALFVHSFGQIANHVVISEVFYLEPTSSPNTEFVELYNPTANDIDLTNYDLRSELTVTTTGSSWSVSLTGKVIKAHGYLLVGRSAVVPTADVVIPAGKNLSNSGIRAGVKLWNIQTNQTYDIVAWDATANVGLEGSAYTAAGITSTIPKSIERKAQSSSTQQSMIGADSAFGNGWDSNDNSLDIVLRDTPQPQNSLSAIESPFSGPDTVAPGILSLKTVSSTQIELQFNEAVDSTTGSTSSNYTINNGISVSQALRNVAGLSKVTLTVTSMSNGVYTLTVASVKDTVGNTMPAPQVINFSYGSIPIAQARGLGAGTSVKVRGIITVGNEFGNPAIIQDSTGALAVFNFNFVTSAKMGDLWEVGGTLKNFLGLLELDPLTDSLRISPGNPQPPAKLIKSDQLIESLESQLVRINRVKFSSSGSFASITSDSSYFASDASGSIEIRVDASTNIPGSPIPADSVSIVGIVNDFNGVYRLMPRSFADIGVTDPAPGQTWMDISVARNAGIGVPVKVRGVVTYNQPGSIIYIQDRTAGLALFDAKTDTLAEGDSVEAVGPLVQFSNLLEMQPVDTLRLFAKGLPVPVAKIVPISQASEFFESQLIRLNGVRFTTTGVFAGNTTYNISDGSKQLQVRIPTGTLLVGQSIPAGAIDIIGVLGQEVRDERDP